MTQLSNVPMQPNPNAVECLTLIEKLENFRDTQTYYEATFADAVIDSCIDIVEQHSQENCNWRNNKDTDGWYEWSDCGDYSSDCGLEWNMSNDDSPLENNMNFCPKCGRKIVEIQPPSEVQDD